MRILSGSRHLGKNKVIKKSRKRMAYPLRTRGSGRGGRGRGSYLFPVLDSYPGRPPTQSWIRPDSVSGFYKLHVSSIPANWNEMMFANHFRKIGNPETLYLNSDLAAMGSPYNWGFIEYKSFMEARDAMNLINGNEAFKGIKVTFARDKFSDVSNELDAEMDNTFDFLNSEISAKTLSATCKSPTSSSSTISVDTPVSVSKMIIKTVKSESGLGATISFENTRMVPYDSEEEAYLKLGLEQRLMDLYKKFPLMGTCETCNAKTNLKCEECSSYYCSLACQTRDWPNHSKICESVDSISHNGSTSSNNIVANESHRNSSKGNGTFDRQNNDDYQSNSRFGERRGNCFGDRQNNFGRSRDDQFENYQERSNGRKMTLFEERRDKYIQENRKRSDRDNCDSDQLNKMNFHNKQVQNSQSDSEAIRKSSYVQNKRIESEEATPSFVLKPEAEHNEDEPNPSSELIQSGRECDVVITVVESPGLFYVQLKKQLMNIDCFHIELNQRSAEFALETQPALGEVCVAQFDGLWSRCKLINMNPLRVKYIDYGNSEDLSPDKLYTLPHDLATKPPAAVKLKLIEGTPVEYLNKTDDETLSVKFLKKVDGYWLACEAGQLINTHVDSQVVDNTQTVNKIQVTSEKTTATLTYPKYLPGGQFTKVTVIHKEASFLAATPAALLPELDRLTAQIQSESVSAAPMTPTTKKCLALCFTTNLWGRGTIVSLEPLIVKFVDFGITEPCRAENVRDIPPNLSSIQPYVVYIKPKDGRLDKWSKGQMLSVRPVFKEDLSSTWIVELDVTSISPVQNNSVPVQEPLLSQIQQLAVATSQKLNSPVQQNNVHVQEPLSSLIQQQLAAATSQKLNSPVQQNSVPAQETLSSQIQQLAAATSQKLNSPVQQNSVPVQESLSSPIQQMADATTQKLTSLLQLNSVPVQELLSSTIQQPAVATSQKLSSPSSQINMQYPEFLRKYQFTEVVIVEHDTQAVDGDTYFVGNGSVASSLVEMSTVLGSVSREVLVSPKIGDTGITLYENDWYRVRVLSLTPLEVLYIDYGNTEMVAPKELKICPDSHKNIPPLVCKVKLAPGTDKKYCNLPTQSAISVKPVSLLPDGSVEVQIEGEVYPDTTSLQTAPVVKPKNILELIERGLEGLEIVPTKLDVARNLILCSVFCPQHFPECSSILVGETFDNLLDSQPIDPNVMPSIGELVAIKKEEWRRAEVLELNSQKWLSQVDHGALLPYSPCKPLPPQYSSLHYMGAVLKPMSPVDSNLFKSLQENDMILEAITVTDILPTGCIVQFRQQEAVFTAFLEKWQYDPLTWSLPLDSGAQVSIVKVINSNTYLVVPVDDLSTRQSIQTECYNASLETLQIHPQVGDYVVAQEDSGHNYCRATIVKVENEKNQCTLYNIDRGNEFEANVDSLRKMTNSLSMIPCRVTPVCLAGVNKVDKEDLPELASLFINKHLLEKTLSIDLDPVYGLVTLTTLNGLDVNKKLQEILTTPVQPEENGKFMYSCLSPPRVPFNVELQLVFMQTNPLYAQDYSKMMTFQDEVHVPIQAYAQSNTALYNPCVGELCIAKYEDEWYRAVCLKETNTGLSTVLFVDYGNFEQIQTSDIRKMEPDFLKHPAFGIKCKIIGLPDVIPPALQSRLDETFGFGTKCCGTIESEQDGEYLVNVPTALTSLRLENIIL